MNRKLHLFCLGLLSTFLLHAQTPPNSQKNCGTGIPDQQWEAWMSEQVEKFKLQQSAGKNTTVVHEIPVIVHVIAWNEVVPTYPNIDSNQIKSQIAVLNQDFGGTGLNVGNLPSAFSGLLSNTGIKFCLAARDRQDLALNPKGIERISASANSWLSPATPSLDLQNYFNTVIIPATIWDPAKYLNIWVSDKPTGYPLNGFATYPPGTSLTGLFNGTTGVVTNDGVWIWAKNFGTVGTIQAPNDLGRTATHEIGHWLGLRHIWGDGNCLSDYCGDTPWTKQPHYGCVAVPTAADQCGVGTSPNGEMPMNFMDRSDDVCMYMFTHDQNIRMQIALSQSSLRYQLGTHNKCAAPIAPTASAVASFTTNEVQCLNKAFTPFNTSSGFPYPTYVWSSSPAASFFPSTSVSHPAVTLSNPGFYTLTLVATNSLSSSTHTFIVSAQNTCAAQSACLDSLKMIKSTDTLRTYKAPQSTVSGCSGNVRGYMTGTNCYKDKEFAQYFPPISYTSTPNPQVNSVIVLFDTNGTKAFSSSSQVTCKIYGGSVGQGPSAVQGQKTVNLDDIVNTTKVTSVGYLGKPGATPITNTKIYPYRFDFATPIIISSSSAGFFAGVVAPNNAPFLDSINVYSNTVYNNANDSSAWYLSSTLTWRTYRSNRNAKIQLAIIPQITCGPVGINEKASVLNSNVMVMPNPSNGLFNLIFTLPSEQELSVDIYNSMGQQISSAQLKNVMNNVVNLDLSDKPNGVYFTVISNGFEKSVKKIVVSH
jgi:hypothetical protein